MAVQIYYQLIRDIVIDEQLLSMLPPALRDSYEPLLKDVPPEVERIAESSCFLFVWNLIKNAAQQPGFFFGNIFIISTQSTSPSLTMHPESPV